MKRSNQFLIGLILTLLAILLAGMALAAGLLGSRERPQTPEVQMALVIVIAVAALLLLLYVVSHGFSTIGLTNANQALGLPEGSIRALIALILIMVFIMFGLHLFRTVSQGTFDLIRSRVTKPEANAVASASELQDRIAIVLPTEEVDGDLYNVWVKSDVNEDGTRLAYQLVTTVGTLAVAVAGFYFGSGAVRSGIEANRGDTGSSLPVIDSIEPSVGTKGEELELTILGTNLQSPRKVQLIRGPDTLEGTKITASPTMIRCHFKLDGDTGAKWDVVVVNENGGTGRMPKAFEIK